MHILVMMFSLCACGTGNEAASVTGLQFGYAREEMMTTSQQPGPMTTAAEKAMSAILEKAPVRLPPKSWWTY